MKKIILMSALLFSFNGWAEMLALECKQYFAMGTKKNIPSRLKNVPLRLETEPRFITINLDEKIWYVGNLEIELVSDPSGTFYSATFDMNDDKLFMQNTLNRLTGEVTLETPVTYSKYACKATKPLW